MGYILPIQSYRSQQYATRLINNENELKVSKLDCVNQIGDFMDQYEETVNKKRMKSEQQNKRYNESANLKKENITYYVNPNPVHVSIDVYKVVDRQSALDAYH